MTMMLNRYLPTDTFLRSPEGAEAVDSAASTGEGQSPSVSAPPSAEPIIADTFETDFDKLDLGFADEVEEDTPPAVLKPKDTAAAPAKVEPAKSTGQEATPNASATPAASPAAPVKEGETAEPAASKTGQEAQPPTAAASQPTESFTAVLERSAEKIVPELAKLYTLPEADAKNFTPEVQTSLKNLAGMLHFNVMRAAAAMIEQMTPQIVHQHTAKVAAQTESEAAFFKAWPQLAKEHVPVIQKYGKMWQIANPQGKVEDYIKQVGAMAANELGLLVASVAALPNGKGTPPAPATKSKAIPFAPANVTSRQQVPLAETHDSNDWGANAMALDLDFDET